MRTRDAGSDRVDGGSVGTTTSSGGEWTLSGLSALAAGEQVTAVANATGKAASDPSAAVTVLAKSDAPVVNAPIIEGATDVSGTTSEADGTSIEVVVRNHILNVLEETNGNISKAAEILGIQRTTLYNKLKKYNCEFDAQDS